MGILFFLFIVCMIVTPMLESKKLNDFDNNLDKIKIGMTLDEVKLLLGSPNSVSEMINYYFIQWQYTSSSGAYHIAMSFDYDLKLIKINSIYKS